MNLGLSFQVPPATAGPAAAGGDDKAPGQTAAQAAAEAATVLPQKRPAGVHAAITLATSIEMRTLGNSYLGPGVFTGHFPRQDLLLHRHACNSTNSFPQLPSALKMAENFRS